jgi:hypothetical protein
MAVGLGCRPTAILYHVGLSQLGSAQNYECSMIAQKEQKDISWLDKGYDVVVKIAGDIEKLEQKSGALMAHLKNKEFYINDIQKGINILCIIARSTHSNWTNSHSLPADYPSDDKLFVSSIFKRFKTPIDSELLNPLFQQKGSEWFCAWHRIAVEDQQQIADICATILPTWQNLFNDIKTKTEETRKELCLVRNEILKKVDRIKQYKYYATKAFIVHEESRLEDRQHSECKQIYNCRKRRTATEMSANDVVSQKKKQKTYKHVEKLMLDDYVKRLKAKLDGSIEEMCLSHESIHLLISSLRSVESTDDEDCTGSSFSHRIATVVNGVNGIMKSSSYFFESETDNPQELN